MGKVERIDGCWWITGFEEIGWPVMGGYDLKSDAESDLAGLRRTIERNRVYWLRETVSETNNLVKPLPVDGDEDE
jgi:hypothetical protein